MAEEINSKSNTTTINPNLLVVTFIVFLTLKLTNNIDWSWWWVTSPLWLPLALTIGITCIVFLVGALIRKIG